MGGCRVDRRGQISQEQRGVGADHLLACDLGGRDHVIQLCGVPVGCGGCVRAEHDLGADREIAGLCGRDNDALDPGFCDRWSILLRMRNGAADEDALKVLGGVLQQEHGVQIPLVGVRPAGVAGGGGVTDSQQGVVRNGAVGDRLAGDGPGRGPVRSTHRILGVEHVRAASTVGQFTFRLRGEAGQLCVAHPQLHRVGEIHPPPEQYGRHQGQ